MDLAVSAAPALTARFQDVRQRTLDLVRPLTPEDMMVQSCPEASPAKWHLAHTAWFFESFILREFLPGYRLFNSDFPWLFNSYYQSFSQFPEKRLRSSFSRPGIEEILAYREHVDRDIERLLDGDPAPEALRRIELGANHEEQHQELLLTDILHAFFTNPLRPAYLAAGAGALGLRVRNSSGAPGLRVGNSSGAPGLASETWDGNTPGPIDFIQYDGGLREAGYSGSGFCFDNELARHRVWLEPFALAGRLVTCAEFAAFIADGGYSRAELWLSAGWDAVQANHWRAPLYWTPAEGGAWRIFTLRGELPLEQLAAAPVSHVSYYEADAYARWAGHRLPTEFEWESAAADQPIAGNLLDSGLLTPAACTTSSLVQNQGRAQHQNQGPTQWYGDVWEWTASAYLAYPGFKPLPGSLGEYNGKFMSGQMVLRGGSCVTPAAHIRPSYRNFFPPETRWQFSGIRLAF
ncbi:MAG TPA: ergothioneine biosynthesis protein EgtB [Terracidiphilus sp.]|nr:ergothioneine biosynthesis protein EgtB [Terracidiphilus sp.]